MIKYRLTHNGYSTYWVDSLNEAQKIIDKRLEAYIDLNPRVIYRVNQLKTGTPLRVIVYQYDTLYQEVFVIETVD